MYFEVELLGQKLQKHTFETYLKSVKSIKLHHHPKYKDRRQMFFMFKLIWIVKTGKLLNNPIWLLK